MAGTKAKVEQAVITDPKIDPSDFMLAGLDTSAKPLFSVSELAKFFFDRTSHWVRWLEQNGAFALDSNDISCTHSRLDAITDSKGKPVKNAKDVEQFERVLLFEDGVCPLCKGVQVGNRRTTTGSRCYDLSDVEKMAHALAQHNAINPAQLRLALILVDTSARIAGYL